MSPTDLSLSDNMHYVKHASRSALPTIAVEARLDSRRQFGLEAAQIALGHSSALVTEAVYAQRDMEKVAEVMTKIG